MIHIQSILLIINTNLKTGSLNNDIMVRPEGGEPSAFWSEARRSIQLSYERILLFLYSIKYK